MNTANILHNINLALASAVNGVLDDFLQTLTPGYAMLMRVWWVLTTMKQLSMSAAPGWYGCAHEWLNRNCWIGNSKDREQKKSKITSTSESLFVRQWKKLCNMQTQLKEKYNLCAHAAKMSFYFLFSCIHFYMPFYSLTRHSFKHLLKVNPKMLTFCSLLLPYHGDFLKYELCPHAPMLLISRCSKVFTLALSTFPTINGQIKQKSRLWQT